MLVGSDGSLIWNFATGANGAATFSLFLANLKDKLDEGRPGWRKNHLILLDGAGSHTAKPTQAVVANLRIPVFYSAAAFYNSLCCDRIFGILKR